MEHTAITEEMLSLWKKEILPAVHTAIRQERKAQDEIISNRSDELISANKQSGEALATLLRQIKTMNSQERKAQDEIIQKIFDELATSNEQSKAIARLIKESRTTMKEPAGTPAPADPSINEMNLIRLLNTFNEALKNAGTAISERNEEEFGQFIHDFTGEFSGVTDDLREKISDSFAEEIKQLGITLEGYSENMTEQNRQALCEVQKENNLELQELAKLLAQLTQENRDFRQTVDTSGQTLSQNVDTLIANSGQFSDTLRSHISEGSAQFGAVMEQQIDRMVSMNAAHEKENANAFRLAMEDYRTAFIQANAEAMAQVQSDMLARMEETQRQMAEMASALTDYFKSAKQHEELMQEEIRKLTDQTRAMNKSIENAMETVGVTFNLINETVGQIKELLEEQMRELTDKLEDVTIESGKTYQNEIKKLTERIDTLLQAVEKQNQSVDETLTAVTAHQKEAHKLASDDMKLLQEMMKKL